MQKGYLILVLLAGALQVTARQQLPDSSHEKLHTAIAGFQAKQHCPGLAVAIVKDDKLIFSHAEAPVTIDTRFPIMSVTKPFVATMLLQLAEQGKLSIHDPVSKYVPEYKVRSNYPGHVATTLFQLATHTSGLPRNTPSDITLAQSYDRWRLTAGKEAIQSFSTEQQLLHDLQYIYLDYPAFDYGERHYSNLGYSVLGIALQRAAKTGFADYVINHICQPLQMTNTGFLPDTNIAKGYRYNNGSYIQLPDFKPNSALYSGGMYSTARDLCKFISFQYEQKASAILSIESRAMMHLLGIGCRTAHSYLIHEGALPGYRCI